METKSHAIAPHKAGFTLLETLVALSVAAIMISTLIPISRSTIMRITKLESENQLLSRLSSRIFDMNYSGDEKQFSSTQIVLKESRVTLSPFTYAEGQREIWQPVLLRVEASNPNAESQKVEYIRLVRQSP